MNKNMINIGEKKNKTPFLVIHPGKSLQDELEARGLTQSEFAEIIGRPARTVNEIINGKRSITPETARMIAAALGTSADLWLGMQADYDLYALREKSKVKEYEVKERSRLYLLFPIPELVRRNYLAKKIKGADELSSAVLKLFNKSSIEQFNRDTCLANFRTSKAGDIVKNYLKSWVLLGKEQAAKMLVKGSFDPIALEKFAFEIKKYSLEKGGITKVIDELSKLGVRMIFLPHFSKTRVDGAVTWLDRNNPIIIMSLRYDRIDNFYFTLVHEIGHILKHPNEAFSDDINNTGDDDKENEANDFASEAFGFNVIVEELKRRKLNVDATIITSISRDLGIHPGLLVGRLHYEHILEYGQYRKALVRIKDMIPTNLQLK
jgi:HTH-type transcriptional regulator/antitoxin HigA